MFILFLLAVASLLRTTYAATTTTGAPTPSASKTKPPKTHTVDVGPKASPYDFDPHETYADVGDVIVFYFYPTNHSVVKADYNAPCVPASGPVFYSGIFNEFQESGPDIVGPAPNWTLTVNDTAPTFYYCTAIDSCIKNGMVGAINPNSSETWKTQHERAMNYPYMLVPGQTMPAEGSSETASAGKGHPSSKLSISGGAIAGIVVGVVAFIAVLLAVCFLWGRNRAYRKWKSTEDGRAVAMTARWAMSNSRPTPSSTQKGDVSINNDQVYSDYGSYPVSPDTGYDYGTTPASIGDLQSSPYRLIQTEPSELQAVSVLPPELPGTAAQQKQ